MQYPIRIAWMLMAAAACAQPPVPSRWEGEVSGSIRGRTFRMPVNLELSAALPHEKNPFHLALTTASFNKIGDLLLASASSVGTGGPTREYTAGPVGVYGTTTGRTPGSGNVTLQYFTLKVDGQQVTAELTETQAAAAASMNSFVGPNVSAEEASDLMRGVHEALGPTEIFVLGRGAVLRLRFAPDGVTGSFEGKGRSVLNTSSDVPLTFTLRARRVK